MSIDNEVRGSKLAERVEEIEKLMRSGVRVTGAPLASLLSTAQAQLEANRIEEEQLNKDKKEKEQKDRSAIAAMVEREEKLSREEKEKYAEFLAKDYFTRSDFNELSRFYTDGGAYDRLSEKGKTEMSDRIQEGIDRGEFTRDELPADVKRKDAEFKGLPVERKELHKGVGEVAPEQQPVMPSQEPATIIGPESKPEMPAKSKPVETKEDVSNVLAGLSKISPVTETDEVSPPQTGKCGSGWEIGG